jgi:hypothetical protein
MVGQELSNGAIELQRKNINDSHDIVLALFNDKFVTWIHNKERNIYIHGNYFGSDLEKALEDFKNRI